MVAATARDLRRPVPSFARATLAGLNALVWGDAPARWVFLHGSALNAHTWDATVVLLDRPALAVDLPGHGESPWRDDADYSPATLAPDVLDALRAAVDVGLAEAPVTLVGQSLGGLAALDVARGDPTLFDRLVLVDVLPLPPAPEGHVAAFLTMPATFDSRDEIAARALGFGFAGPRAELDRAVWHNTRELPDGRVTWKHHFGHLDPRPLDLGDPDVAWRTIAELPCRVDLVWGTRSVTSEQSRARFAALRPTAAVTQIDSGHNIQEDAPHALAQALARP
ncbi:MAG: alpha/beta hydrolase [Propionibacteriaceae bacterium]|nr:alpha/beta hydrolase [Propionibacteriaceae bacterium]